MVFTTGSGRAFSSLGCPELDLPAMLALARAHGIAGIELRTVAGQMDLPAYFEQTYGTPARLASLLSTAPARVLALSTSFKLAEPAEAERAQLLAHVAWAEAAGIPWLRVFDGGRASDDATLQAAAETWRWWRQRRERECWRVDLLIETHDSLVDEAALRSFLVRAPGAVLLWDAHNTWRKTGEDPATLWPAIRRRVAHIHVKDSISRPSARHPFTFVLPGAGEFPMAPLRHVLAGDYDGLLSLEWERQWHPYLPPLAEALVHAGRTGWW
jgi:sugar phosphate isomerase/epimerase